MDLRRFLGGLLLLCSAPIIHAAETAENYGIAFVHGTNDHRNDADGSYWKTGFIEELASALPSSDNKIVVRCDFSQYMWQEETSGCLADQLLDFIRDKKLSKVIVYTHSNGGNVMRYILSNPTYDLRFLKLTKKIHQVVALAPSSGGTVLADEAIDGNIFETGLSWLLGYQTASVKQQRVGDMAIYNDELLFGTKGRPPLARPFNVVVGTDVTSSPFSSASYCNGYLLNAALKITRSYLSNCSDGFLDCESQNAAGSVWFYDWEKTTDKTPLSHNQSRHSCFGLEQILRDDIVAQGVNA